MAKTIKNNNMKIWRSVEKTNPKYTKEVGFGRKFTSINAQYQIMTSTEQFGSFGSGWGVSDERFDMIADGLLGYQAHLWYMDDDERCSFCINSSIKTHSIAGKLDDEIYKKVSTDALTKGLSKLGFNADVFLGLWDDNRYVNQMKDEFKETTTKKPAPKKQITDDVIELMLKAVKEGKKDAVLKRMTDYTLNKTQEATLIKAMK
jgi:hypothetical protein